MKLNKKYEPQKKIINKNSVQADYLFPVILPSYVKISWKTLPQYLNQVKRTDSFSCETPEIIYSQGKSL